MKWRFFRHLYGGGDDDAERVYRWHIEERSGPRMNAGLATDGWKESPGDYVTAARLLFESMMRNGFASEYAVPIDPRGELLDGSHRVACALAIGLPEITVSPQPRPVWAPSWDLEWFKAHGMHGDDLLRLVQDWETMNEYGDRSRS